MLSKTVIKLVMCLVILVLVQFVSCKSVRTERKFKRNVEPFRNVWNSLRGEEKKTEVKEKGRGLFGGLFTIGKVLNFFPVGGERECQPEGFTVAKAGICLNPYDCRQRDGKASGDCAHGLGVCCVFEVSCGGVVQNNLTYFMSPGFPELWGGDEDCNITIEKTYAGIMQLKIDFLHFTIGQPNRTTGECDEDAMILGDGDSKFTLCGQNHNQHIYYTLSSGSERREAGDLPGSKIISLAMRMRGGDMPRLWLMRLAQMPLAHSAPHDCLQYFTADNGTIKTFNYAINGRHLASQEYKACVRRNVGFCSVRYQPCDHRSFRIGPSSGDPAVMDPADQEFGPGASGGAGSGFDGPDGSFGPTTALPTTTLTVMDQLVDTENDNQDQMMPVNNTVTQEDELEGSGDDPQIETPAAPPQPGMMSRIWQYFSGWVWGQGRGAGGAGGGWSRWSPYAQHYATGAGAASDGFRYFGYGNYGVGLRGYGRQRCQDRVSILCENEYFVSSSVYGGGVCDPHHCGPSFCPGQAGAQCRVDTSVTPFAVGVHFGPPAPKRSPEDNIGMCLRYTQLPCDT